MCFVRLVLSNVRRCKWKRDVVNVYFYKEAIIVAIFGLAVNVASAFLLHSDTTFAQPICM